MKDAPFDREAEGDVIRLESQEAKTKNRNWLICFQSRNSKQFRHLGVPRSTMAKSPQNSPISWGFGDFSEISRQKSQLTLCVIPLTCAKNKALLTLREKMMKTTIVAAATAMLFAAPALAWEGQVVECYGKVWSPAEYKVKHKLEKPAKWMWEHRNGQLTKVYYAPVYSEHRHKTKEGHWIMRAEPCND